MDAIDQIFEVRAELRGCRLTKAERAKAEGELAVLIAQLRAEEEKIAEEIPASLDDRE